MILWQGPEFKGAVWIFINI